MTRRKLTQEEIALWHKVNEQTDRLHSHGSGGGPGPAKPPAKPLPKPKPTKPVNGHADLPRFEIGQSVRHGPAPHDLKKPLPDRLSQGPVAMDRKAYGRMRRGKLTPEARIDLHGMTLAQAHPVLNRFILTAQANGLRLVLVITGKGKTGQDEGPIPRPRGVLKHQVPDWLSRPPLSQAVLQTSEAHISHGGVGAYYVYLRRSR